jgi:hypothetical protein
VIERFAPRRGEPIDHGLLAAAEPRHATWVLPWSGLAKSLLEPRVVAQRHKVVVSAPVFPEPR